MASNKTYTKVEIEAVQEGLNHYFPYEIGFISTPKTVDDKWSDLNGVFKWHGRDDFFTTLSEITKIERLSFAEIKSASGILEKMKAGAPETVVFKGAEDSPVQANRPGKEMLEQLERENQTKETLRKEVVEKSDQEVRSAIRRQQEIYTEQVKKAKVAKAALKDKKIYYKIEKVSVKDTPEVKDLKEQAGADPKRFVEDAANQFSNNPNLKNLSNTEAQIISKQAAVTSYEVLTDNSPLIQSVIISKIASDPEILNSISSPETREYFKNAAELLTNQKISQYELSKQLLDFSKIDGYENANDVKIEFSYIPRSGFKEFDLSDQIITPYVESLNQQNALFGNLSGLGESEIRSQILSSAGVRLESYVAKLPANSLLAKTYHSEAVQLGLTRLGIVEAAPWVAVEGSYVGNIAIMSGLGPAAGFVQAKTGIDLGVKLATKTGVKTAAEAGATVIAKTGVETAAKTGLKGAISKLTASLGSAAGPIGTALGWLGGEVLVKIAEKIPWHTVKKWSAAILGGTVFLTALPFIGLGGAVGAGLGATAISATLGGGLGGLTMSRVGSGIAGFFGAVAGATLGAIGGPILGILLGFPLIVVFILFIINSGAYVVPPTSLDSPFANGGGINIVCSKEKGPVGVPGPSSSSPIATRAWEITADLYQGFWCYWNRSPKAPPPHDQDFPNDTVDYPPSYPNEFNYSLFKTNPNGQEGGYGADDLFWCTWLIVKAYQESGTNISVQLWVPNMYNDFNARGKIVEAKKATPSNIVPGSVVFFHVTTGEVRLNHVAIVYSVDPGGMSIVQSNAPLKSQTINFKSGGGVGNLPYMNVEYFGLP